MRYRATAAAGLALVATLGGVATAATWSAAGNGSGAAAAISLSTPAGLTSDVATPGQVDLSWSSSASATGYVIQRYSSSTGNTGQTTACTTTSTTSCTDTGVTAGTTYYYTVEATRSNWLSAESASRVSATPASALKLHVSALTAAEDPQNGQHYGATVTVTVRDNSGNAVSGVVVTGAWAPTSSANNSCSGVTNAAGVCTFTVQNNMFNTSTSNTWTAAGLSKSNYVYDATADAKHSITVNCTGSSGSTCSSN